MHFALSQEHELLNPLAFQNIKSPSSCKNRAVPAPGVPYQKPLMRFDPNLFKHIPYNLSKLSQPLDTDCNSIFKLHHFCFQLVQVEFYKLVQAHSKQTRHWGRSEEVQASSQTSQASLKSSTLPYTSSTETGFCQLPISLFRNH